MAIDRSLLREDAIRDDCSETSVSSSALYQPPFQNNACTWQDSYMPSIIFIVCAGFIFLFAVTAITYGVKEIRKTYKKLINRSDEIENKAN